MNDYFTADIIHPKHLPLFSLATRISEADSIEEIRNSLNAMIREIRGRPMETRLLACTFMLAALGADLLETAEQFAQVDSGNINELTRIVITERVTVQKQLDCHPADSQITAGLVNDLHDIEDELRMVDTPTAFERVMTEVRPCMADGGITAIRFVEKTLTTWIITNLIPCYLNAHPEDDLTDSRYKLWWLLDSLIESSTPYPQEWADDITLD